MNRMFRRISCVCAVVLACALSGCGGGAEGGSPVPTAPTPTPTPPAAPLPAATVTPSGPNWSFSTDGGAGVLNRLDGSFNASGDAVTAVLSPSGSLSCFQPDSDRARFTGTRAGRAIQMRSQPLRNQVIDLSGTLSADGEAFDGAYTITGGCAQSATTAMAGRAVMLTGVWAGKLGNIPAVVDLQMASTPDESAGYPVSGTVKFSNTQCFANATITRRVRGRWLFPDIVSLTQRLELLGNVSDDLSTMNFAYVLVEGTCPELRDGDGALCDSESPRAVPQSLVPAPRLTLPGRCAGLPGGLRLRPSERPPPVSQNSSAGCCGCMARSALPLECAGTGRRAAG